MSILHYTEAGQGEALILLHSGGMSGREWEPQIVSLARYFRVIIPDQIGHGETPMIAAKLTIGDIGREVIEVLDKLNIPVSSFLDRFSVDLASGLRMNVPA